MTLNNRGVRDQIKTVQYFDAYMDVDKELRDDFNDGLSNGTIKPDRVASVKYALFMSLLNSFVAKYSRGDTMEQLKNHFLTIIPSLEENWRNHSSEPDDKYSFDSYVKTLWLLSWGILLRVDDASFQRMVTVFDRDRKPDFLMDTIIRSRIPSRPISSTQRFAKQYERLIAVAIEPNKDNAAKEMAAYLQKSYYNSMKMVYWHNTHNNQFDVYFGYWCFEAAAIAYVAGIDDSLFRGDKYYPKDLVDYARSC